MILLALRQEQPGRERRDVEMRERERRIAESAELLAKRRGIERPLARERERLLCANRDRFAVGGEHGLERRTSGAEEPYVETRLAGANFGGQRRVAGPCALEQLRLRRAN